MLDHQVNLPESRSKYDVYFFGQQNANSEQCMFSLNSRLPICDIEPNFHADIAARYDAHSDRSSASSTPGPSSSSIATLSPARTSGALGTVSAIATSGVAATMTAIQLPAGSGTMTPIQLAGGTATTIATQSSTGTATFTPTLTPTLNFTLTPKSNFTSTFTSTTSATPILGGHEIPNARFGFIVGSITDDTAIVNVMSQTGAGAWIPYDDLRVSGPDGRINLIRTGAQRPPPSFDAVVDEAARGRPGAYWLIGNEPNLPGQDHDGRFWTNGEKVYASSRGAATRYVEAFRYCRAPRIPPRIVFGNFPNFDSTCEACGGFFSVREHLDKVQLAFQAIGTKKSSPMLSGASTPMLSTGCICR